MAETAYRKKLIEVALPLPEINDASAYDKMPGNGPHPKGIRQLVGTIAIAHGSGGIGVLTNPPMLLKVGLSTWRIE